jgi:UDP-N-acetylmuramate dehydrogenase
MVILENYSLKKHNTFGVEAKSRYYVDINYRSDIHEVVQCDEFQNNQHLILGGGSNILFTEDFDGIVINMNLKGIKITNSSDGDVELEVAAGVIWHDLVKTCLKSKFYGLENLALIPGKVGAAPVQNIGAYGVEQKDFFTGLKAFDFETKEIIELNKEDCKFGYRDSIFKNELKGKAIVTSVKYKLSKKFYINDSYKALRHELGKFSFIDQDAQYLFDTICRIRNSKLPDINKIGSGGSFFKNPVISQSIADKLLEEFPDMPNYPTNDGMVKLSSAWMIDKSGMKGFRRGDAGVYDKHALVLVNYGNASGKEIMSIAQEIKEKVEEKFGIALENEVIVK